jgi:phosphate transport system substrate-binding protein
LRSSLRFLRVGALVAALALVAAACGDDDSNGSSSGGGGNGDLSGTVRADGSSTVAPLSEAAAELFEGENSGVRVGVATSGTGGGFEKFCNGETDISDASRPISDEEAAACESNGIAYDQLVVANDALSVLVNPENPVDCLTVEQLNAVWGPDSDLGNWSEIPDLDADFDEGLDLYGPGTDSGTFDYFTEAINGEEGASRTDYNNIGEGDNQGISGVQSSVGGMFYVGFSFFAENEGTVKALEVDGGDGCVAPSLETVQDGTYTPLGRELFIYVSDTALQKPEVLAFVEFYIENQAEVAEAAGYIPMTDEQAQESLDKVQALAGT